MSIRSGLPAASIVWLLLTGCAAGPEGTDDAPLEGTRWVLTQLGTQAATTANPEKAPYLELQASDKRVVGSGGCNRLGGSYTLEGSKLTFGQMMGTMMACPHGMEQEQALRAALPTIAGWRISGQTLVLLDTAGQQVATFEARP